MYINAIYYKGDVLAPGSHAAELHAKKDFKALDKHLKYLSDKKAQLEGTAQLAKLTQKPASAVFVTV